MTKKKQLFNPVLMLIVAVAALALPASAAAMDCGGKYFLCILEFGGSSHCVHEYVGCLAEAIRAY